MAQTKYKLAIEAINKTKKTFAAVTKGLKGIGNAAKAVGKGLGVALAVVGSLTAAFIALGAKAFSALDDIAKTAERVGIGTAKIQALQLAAVESGSSIEALNKAIEKFSKNIGDVIVKGTGEASYALQAMNITLRDSNGFLKDNETLLNEVADGIQKMGTNAEKSSALTTFFGRAGGQMFQLFANGSGAIDEFVQKAEKMGFIVGGPVFAAVQSFNDRMSELKFILNGLVNQTFAALAPGLDTIIKQIVTWAEETQSANGGLESIGKTIAVTLVSSIAQGIEAIGLFGDQIELFGVAAFNSFTELKIALLEFISAMPLARDRSQEILLLTDKLKQATGSFGQAANKSAEQLRSYFDNIINGTPAIEKIVTTTEEATEGFFKMNQSAQGFAQGFSKVMLDSGDKFKNFELLGTQVASTLESGLTQAFMNIGKGLDGLRDLADTILKMIIQEMIRIQIVAPFMSFLGFTPMAKGGPVSGGSPYLVGEQGPELFVPGSSGNIIPNNQLGGGGSTNVNVTFDIKSWDSQDTLQAISEQAPLIVGIVDNAFSKRGRRGPLGA